MDTEAYQKALQRAEREGVRVMGTGTEEWWDTGIKAQVWFVSSGHPDAEGNANCYTVKLIDGEREMSCDCTAAQYGKPCKHRVTVHHLLSQTQQAPKQATQTRAPSVVRLVQYDGRPGRGSKCAVCGQVFTKGEWIALQGGQALHDKCVERPATSTRPSDTAVLRRSDKPFSLLK